ncbi:MAG TPA: hypothetical protein VJ653_08130 [Acidimicrobiales bacterium]|nr:hypothetical protein [Acidimicrobiales bacterium]
MNEALVDELVRAATPCPDDLLASLPLEQAEAQLCAAIVARPPLVVVPRRRVTRVLVAGVVALSLTAAAWAVGPRTGLFGGGPGSEEGSGEFIRLDAGGAGAILDDIAQRVSLPPGGSFEQAKTHLQRPEPDGRGRVMTESGIEAAFAGVAACQWTGYWLDGYQRGDAAQMARAQTVLDQIPTWPIIVASDGGGYVALLTRRAEGARAGDPSGFLPEYRVNCAP